MVKSRCAQFGGTLIAASKKAFSISNPGFLGSFSLLPTFTFSGGIVTFNDVVTTSDNASVTNDYQPVIQSFNLGLSLGYGFYWSTKQPHLIVSFSRKEIKNRK
ncbi:MAG: hypothetical protein AAFZ15_11240 [Bacteroidota bacterium]